MKKVITIAFAITILFVVSGCGPPVDGKVVDKDDSRLVSVKPIMFSNWNIKVCDEERCSWIKLDKGYYKTIQVGQYFSETEFRENN